MVSYHAYSILCYFVPRSRLPWLPCNSDCKDFHKLISSHHSYSCVLLNQAGYIIADESMVVIADGHHQKPRSIDLHITILVRCIVLYNVDLSNKSIVSVQLFSIRAKRVYRNLNTNNTIAFVPLCS